MTILKRNKPKKNDRIDKLKSELKNGTAYVKFSMNIPRSLHAEFRKKTFLADMDMKDVLMDAIRKYMAK